MEKNYTPAGISVQFKVFFVFFIEYQEMSIFANFDKNEKAILLFPLFYFLLNSTSSFKCMILILN